MISRPARFPFSSRPGSSGNPRRPPLALLCLLLPWALVGCSGGSESDATASDGDAAAQAPEPRPTLTLAERPNLFLLTIDTLRADHLSAYGHGRPTSPRIDRLAAEGVRFDRAAVQWPKTGPSFASMLSSTYPKDTGIVRHVGIPVPESVTLLAQLLEEEGYDTRAIVANGALSSELGYQRGFSTYVESWRNPPEAGTLDPDGAERVTDLAIELGRQMAEDDDPRPFFLWVHYLDPHFPYAPPEPWASQFVDDGLYDPGKTLEVDRKNPYRQMLTIGYEQELEKRNDLAFYISRYDGEIAYLDSHLDRLLAEFESLGLLDNTLTALTSDHGESLGEHHYYFDHGRFGFQTCLRVPLILHFPGVLEPRVDGQPVELIHLAPTFLEFAGVELEDGRWNRGQSLVPRLLGREASSALAFSEAGFEKNGRWQRIVQNRRYKLIYARSPSSSRWIGGEKVPYALYDLENDPEETVNVAEEKPEAYRHLRQKLKTWLESGPDEDAKEALEADELDVETREQLRALGYIE